MNVENIKPYLIINLLLLPLLFAPTDSTAQKLIPRVALSISSTTNEPSSPTGEVSTRKAVSYGLGVQVQVGKQLELLLELDHVSKGHKFYSNREASYDPDTRIIFESEYKHNYLVIPVLVKKYFGTGNIQPYLSAGPFLGIGLGGKFEGEFGVYDRGFALAYDKYDGKIYYGDDPINNGENDRYYTNSVDWGISIGSGITVFQKLALDIRYEIGQRNADEGFGDYKNRTIYFGIMVPLKLRG